LPKPYITALLDTYNQGRFIEEAIASVLAQDFPQNALEIIVVDDGSTDDTAQRVRRFGERIRYIYKPNGGQASALNAGFAAAQGEIISLLDGDDTWLPGKLTAIAGALEENPEATMAYHAMSYRNEKQKSVTLDKDFCAISGEVLASMDTALRYGAVSTSSMALRRAAAQRLLPIPEGMRIYADSYLAYLAIFLGPVVGLDAPLTQYRIHGANLASNANPSAEALQNRCNSFSQALAAMRAWLAGNGVDAGRDTAAAFLQRQELVETMLRHLAHAPGRLDFYRYLSAFNKLYAPLWNVRYRSFRAAMAAMGLLLGYAGFAKMQQTYASGSALRFREQWIASGSSQPAQMPHTAHTLN